jgi:hypothetical protein
METMDYKVLENICRVLSTKIMSLERENIRHLTSKIESQILKNLIEAKLVTYRGFEPLWWLINAEVRACQKIKIQACFAESAQLRGQAGKTTVASVKQTLINWQSVSDQGRDHKKKELCGRAVALRYTWDAESKKFMPRPGVKKLILVVDGTWRQDDLETLARAGWDEIFYPDEMNKLAQAIV